ncbi:hypothetical protein RCL1_005503 [Eukaryota sp. TZLM3-RCL]
MSGYDKRPSYLEQGRETCGDICCPRTTEVCAQEVVCAPQPVREERAKKTKVCRSVDVGRHAEEHEIGQAEVDEKVIVEPIQRSRVIKEQFVRITHSVEPISECEARQHREIIESDERILPAGSSSSSTRVERRRNF